jgi:preprotein translocase subunit YajC
MNYLFLLQQQAPQGQGGFMSWAPTVGMIVLLIVIFYFFMIRPQQKRQKKLQEAREALTKGDKVVTAGGIHGKIVEIRDQTFVIAVEDNTHIEVDKTAIAFNEAALK